MRFWKRIAVGFLLTSVLWNCTACEGQSSLPDDSMDSEKDVSAWQSSELPETGDSTSAESESETEVESSVAEKESTETVESESTDSSSAEETDGTPEPINPLTGLVTEADLSAVRPIAVMINNIQVSCPQNGVASADIIYECLVEGGYTRLMMLTMEYGSLAEVGSVRSVRDYYLDFAADYDAILVHAGGSPYAYESIRDRQVNNLDGVNMYLPGMFYRSQERIVSMGLEHSLMTTGQNIVAGIQYKKYRTALTENFDYPLDFTDGSSVLSFADSAKHIRIPYSVVQTTDFVYDADSATYLRYQFQGKPHVDGLTNEQLSFTNLLILFCETGAITGDESNRIQVDTVGEGSGYYMTAGTRVAIRWVKDSHESPIRFFLEDDEPLLMNPGKTFVSVCPTYLESQIEWNAK